MSVMFVYTTAGDAIEARRIARAVVDERLAACGNVIGGMSSVYWWNGVVQESTEAVLILKTTAERLEALIARVKSLHSYDCPCIEALPVTAGNQAFLDWIAQETQSHPGTRAVKLPGEG